MTVLKNEQVLEELALTQSGVLASDRPRSSPISCTVSLFAADSIAIILSVIVVACCGAFLSSALAMQAQPNGVWALRDVLILYVVNDRLPCFQGPLQRADPVLDRDEADPLDDLLGHFGRSGPGRARPGYHQPGAHHRDLRAFPGLRDRCQFARQERFDADRRLDLVDRSDRRRSKRAGRRGGFGL